MTQHPYLPVKALSIRQPWAWAILNAGKRIVVYTRRSDYRGPICLHASSHSSAGYHITAMLEISRARGRETAVPYRDRMERGGIIGTADIVDCVEHSDSPWFFGPFGLVLENVKPTPFIPVKGALGLFDWRKKLETNND